MKRTKYHQAICKKMEEIAKIRNSFFLGQQVGVTTFYDTLINIPMTKRLELPVAEEMQLGMSIGMAMEGYLPISIFQRMDFLPRACDQLVNHLDILKEMSHGVYNPKIIIFVTIGATKPLDSGLQHSKDLIEGFQALLKTIPVYDLQTVKDVNRCFNKALKYNGSSILVARQDLF